MAISLNKLAKAVDDYDMAREARLAADKVAADLKKKENDLYNFLIDNISKSDASGVIGKRKCAKVVTRTEPTPESWDKVFAYVKKTNSFDLLQKRLSAPAVRERWEDNREIPGVGRIQVVSISLTKP